MVRIGGTSRFFFTAIVFKVTSVASIEIYDLKTKTTTWYLDIQNPHASNWLLLG
jgi:hypothetical protein